MSDQPQLCPIHLKSQKFFCFQPCSSFFCSGCAIYHRSHIIRDLVTNPLIFEQQRAQQIKDSLQKNHQNLIKQQEESKKLLSQTKSNQKLAILKIEEEFERACNAIKEKLLKAKEIINKEFMIDTQMIVDYTQKLEEAKKGIEKKNEILDSMKRMRPDQFNIDLIDFINDSCDFKKNKLKAPQMRKISVPLLKNSEVFYESI